MHRSGTSLCAQALRSFGVDMGHDVEERSSNLKGQWERLEIVERHDRILRLLDRSYYSSLHDLALPTGWWTLPEVREIRAELVALVKREQRAGAAFGFKDPRTARLLPMWRQIFEELGVTPKIALCVRAPAQVARSLAERDGLPTDLGEFRWLVYMSEIMRNLRSDECCIVPYEAWFDGSAGNASKLAALLGIALDDELRARFANLVDPELRHDDDALPVGGGRLVRGFHDLLLRLDSDPLAPAELNRMLDQLAAHQELYQAIEAEFVHASRVASASLASAGIAVEAAPRAFSWRSVVANPASPPSASAADNADAERTRLSTVLRQRAELDAELARTQQEAALREFALDAARRQIAELRRRLGPAPDLRDEVDFSADSALRCLAEIPAPPHGYVDSNSAERAIEAVLAEPDPDLRDLLLRSRVGDAEFHYILARKLIDAGFLEQAEEAASNAVQQSRQRQARYYERLAGVRWMRGKRQDAIAPMQTASELDPHWDYPRECLARMLAEMPEDVRPPAGA